MMLTLYDKIMYHDKSYFELTEPEIREKVEQLVAKLRLLESEIVNDPKGTITITNSGNVFIDNFDPVLTDKISKIVSGRR